MKRVRSWWERALWACALTAAAGAMSACGSSAKGSAPTAGTTARAATTYHTNGATAGAIRLKDRTGADLAVGATTPYSPERTCGGCHDVAKITEGYHFQQGKGFSSTDIRVADNYNPSKPWLLSDGMFGKW